MAPQHPSSATTVFLDQPPSCLQFHPSSPNHLVIGTYLLSEHSNAADGSIQQTKTGSLQLWHLEPATHQLSLIEKFPIAHAVFDLHFHPQDPTLLAIVTSAGCVSFFRVALPSDTTTTTTTTTAAAANADGSPSNSSIITHLTTHQAHPTPNIPALFLAWTPPSWPLLPPQEPQPNSNSNSNPNPSSIFGFAITFSDGSTTLFTSHSPPSHQFQITNVASFNATQPIEVWFVALATIPSSSSSSSSPSPSSDGNEPQSRIPYMFTGNDFGSVHTRSFDPLTMASPDAMDDGNAGMILNHDDRGRHHTAGVTAILPLPIPLDVTGGAPWLLTGSYDESLRVYSASRRGEVLGEVGLGGGVWRLQVLESVLGGSEWVGLVLASCMHGGTRVVRVRVGFGERDEEGCEMEVLAEFTEHESMNYASDVWRVGDEVQRREKVVVVSSSFYDRRVCVWTVDV
ncbi:hypothetical protein BO71DRAFT_423183 [Aspergillus ellipticus CBS 707.79]|uniref:WD40 repeat-like protein n=1 Tax=Aspergillus ellipticus CBS 707.79 TaxID=1448320 RepID=A0A319CV75_9EURO|nr:hypothetical protein BO71DRAFT_423183 [Aspergillus ellipticus CBS 707.79]